MSTLNKQQTVKELKSNSKKATSKLVKQHEKEVIKNSLKTISDEELLSSLDSLNLDAQLEKLAPKKASNTTNNEVKKFNYLKLINDYEALNKDEKKKAEKDIRKKARRLRNKFIDNTLFWASQKDISNLKQQKERFNSFYKEYYSLNDYSINSIADARSDKDTLQKVELFIRIIKSI